MFPTAMHYWSSMAYSCLKTGENYSVELVTDSLGAQTVESLNLPYSSISTKLNDIDESVDPRIWAFSKLYTYSLQQEPFAHIDCDAYLLKKLDDSFLDVDIVCQHQENSTNLRFRDAYHKASAMSDAPRRPIGWDDHVNDEQALCMGIFGGNQVESIREYAEDAMSILTCSENKDFWNEAKKSQPSHFNVILEQQGAYCYFKKKEIEISPLLRNEDYVDRIQIGNDIGFTHLMARKNQIDVCKRLEKRMFDEYPDYMETILSVIGKY
jgi:predicted house-cleaning noncanonical NTP pyrophosphatase (MazG superfamily)